MIMKNAAEFRSIARDAMPTILLQYLKAVSEDFRLSELYVLFMVF